MTNKDETGHTKFERLADALARDVDRLTADEIIQEVAEDHGDVERVIADMKSVIQSAISVHGKRRLAAARQGYKARTDTVTSKVVQLPLARKRELIEQFAQNDNQLRGKLTMAARNEKDQEADLDSFLKDLVQLGVIDDDGNVQ